MLIQAVTFLRTKKSGLESGILIGHLELIIDRQHKMVRKIHKYTPKPDRFCISLSPILEKLIEIEKEDF